VIGDHPGIRPALTPALELSRATTSYAPKQPAKDWALKIEIEEVLRDHPSYGHKQLALALQRNKKRCCGS
jgi:hypothetical protein